ncbi:MAG: hypothetical protein BM555_06795 [Crocinitomix sp. MedPE-SWsnd]|jgi:hypothetical protein|nr:MAG: hypothetical protein BM555_06795 [Crocinitomix sp. MedPE-SWsnd]
MKFFYLTGLFSALVLLSAFVYPTNETAETTNEIEDLDVIFRVEICAYENHVPHDKVVQMRSFGKVKVVRKDGMAHYYSKPYATEAQVISDLPHYINVGFEDAFEVAEIDNEFYTLDEYHQILEDKEGIIRIHK